MTNDEKKRMYEQFFEKVLDFKYTPAGTERPKPSFVQEETIYEVRDAKARDLKAEPRDVSGELEEQSALMAYLKRENERLVTENHALAKDVKLFREVIRLLLD